MNAMMRHCLDSTTSVDAKQNDGASILAAVGLWSCVAAVAPDHNMEGKESLHTTEESEHQKKIGVTPLQNMKSRMTPLSSAPVLPLQFERSRFVEYTNTRGNQTCDNITRHYVGVENEFIHQGANSYVTEVVVKGSRIRRCMKKVPRVSMRTYRLDTARQELDIMSKIDHPNFVKVYECLEEFRHNYYIIEYFPGVTVQDIFRFDAIEPDRSEDALGMIIWQCLEAMRYLHDLDIVHNDIQPRNVMLDKSHKHVKIIDFGEAQIVCFNAQRNPVQPAGTLMYMAPERFFGFNKDERVFVSKTKRHRLLADIWSLGCLLYFLATGTHLYGGGDEASLTRQNMEKRHADLNTRNEKIDALKGYSRMFRHLIKTMTSDRPSRPTAEECLKMRFFNQHKAVSAGVPPSEADKKLWDQLRQITGKNRLQMVICNAVAHNVDIHALDLKPISELFRSINTDGNGSLSQEELVESAQLAGWTKTEAEKLIACIDINGDGEVSLSEFIAAIYPWSESFDEDFLKLAFKTLDIKHDGFITVDELAYFAKFDEIAGRKKRIKIMIRELNPEDPECKRITLDMMTQWIYR